MSKKKTVKKGSALDTTPESVAIVALGPSNHDYVAAAGCKKNFITPDEVWVVNSGAGVFHADKIFVMDDLRKIAKRFPEWGAKLKSMTTPIITCHQYEEFPSSLDFPLEEVFNDIKDDVFSTTVAYMVAYAIYKKVHTMYLFGCDFYYPGSASVEPGAAGVTYLLGMAKSRGINFKIPNSSTLLDAHMVQQDKETGKFSRPLYGYDYNPGESKKNVQMGRGTDLDIKAAEKCPGIDPDKLNGKGKKSGGKDAAVV